MSVDTPGIPYQRLSADGKYVHFEPGVSSTDFMLEQPQTEAGATTVVALSTPVPGRFVVKPCPPGAIGDVVGPASATDNAITRYDGTTGKLVQNSVVTVSDTGAVAGVTTINGAPIPSPIGDVVGPAGATDNAVARYDGATGKLIQNSVVAISDTGAITGVASLNGSAIPSPIGDVFGPAGAVADNVAVYNGVTGKLIKDSGATISAGASVSGSNTGDVTLTAFGAAPNANGATLTGQALTNQPANALNPGGVSIVDQDFSGVKNFTNGVRFGNTPLGGPNSNILTYYDEATAATLGGLLLSGPWVGTVAHVWGIARIGPQLFFNIGETVTVSNGAPALITAPAGSAPPGLRPIGNPRSAITTMIRGGVRVACAFTVFPNGSITFDSDLNGGTYPAGGALNGVPVGGITVVVRI